ncbi:MAG: hypothetical protein HY661_00025 [Betaproteobacteria bacterium]|nr:hypothetical protein [Betaproteobacteria bacterium]
MNGSNGSDSGIPEVDDEDRALGALANELNRAIACGDEAEIQRLMNRLLADARTHFANEERMLHAAAYPRLKGHAALHIQMRAEMEHAMEQFGHTRFHALWNEYGLLVKQLVTEHAVQERALFRDFLQSTSIPNS